MAEPDASYSQLRSSIATLGVHVRSQAVEQRVCGKRLWNCSKESAIRGSSKSSVMREWYQSCSHALTGSTRRRGSIVALTAAMAESYPGCGGKSPEAGKSSMRLEVRWESALWRHEWSVDQCWTGARTRGCCTRGTSAARESLSWRREVLHSCQSCVLEARLVGIWLVPAKADVHFYDPQGIKWDLVSYAELSILMRRWSMSRSRQACETASPCRLIAIHLPTEQRRVKP